MSLIELDTVSVEEFLCLMSDFDVANFGELCPEHQEAVDAIWTHRRGVNVDNVLIKDIDKLLQLIESYKTLKGVIFKQPRPEFSFAHLPAAIASNCSNLKVLDIPGLTLFEQDVQILSTCSSLTHLNIQYYEDATEFVPQLIANNPQLEAVCLNGPILNNYFLNLPETIKQIEILDEDQSPDQFRSFWMRLNTWKLTKLSLNVTLIEKDILRLRTQNTLKHIQICFNNVGNSLEILFRINQRLEEVHLCSLSNINGACLKYLPNTLKYLNLLGYWHLDEDDFLEYIKKWNLNSLEFSSISDRNFNTSILEAAPSLCELGMDARNMLFDEHFENFEKLAQLKILHLEHDNTEHNKSLKILLKNCINLQKLTLNGVNFDHEVFPVIAALPKLKEFFLCYYMYRHENFVSCMQKLSRSKSLTTVKFEPCQYVSKADILTHIRCCRTTRITKLILGSCDPLYFDEDFLKEIVLEMETQTDRKEVLFLEIICIESDYEEISTINLHPMLNLEIYWQY